MMRIAVLLCLFGCLQAWAEPTSFRALYEEMEFEATGLPPSVNLPQYAESLDQRLKGFAPSALETRALILEIYRRITTNPKSTCAVKTLQLAWLRILIPRNEPLLATIKGYLNHDIPAVRWIALFHLKSIYDANPHWQVLAMDFLKDAIRRSREIRYHDPDRLQEELMIGKALMGELIRSDIKLIAPMEKMVAMSYVGVGRGTVLDAEPLKDLKASVRTGRDPVVLNLVRSIVRETREMLDELRFRPVEASPRRGSLMRSLSVLAEIIVDKGIVDSSIVTEMRIFIDDPHLSNFAGESLREKFLNYYSSLNLLGTECRVLLFPPTPAKMPAAPFATVSVGSGGHIPASR